MHIKSLIFCCLFLLAGTLSEEETITWSATKKLTWADFKASAKSDSNAVALTASGITFGFSIKTADDRVIDFTTTVTSDFYPNKSWYLRKNANSYILRHEQLHFDLTELYTRKLRQQLSQLQTSQKLRADLKTLHTAINDSLNETQIKYDTQSEHSLNRQRQNEWEQFVSLELEKLDKFKSR